MTRRWGVPARVGILLSAVALVPAAPSPQDVAPETKARIVPLFQAARNAEKQREMEKAASIYDQVLALAPALAEAWTNKGLVLYELNRHREAEAAFAKAVELKPGLLTPQLFLGIEYLRHGEAARAIVPLKAALRLQPDHPQATYELARAYVELQNFELGTATYQGLVKRAPDMEQAQYGLGIAYLNWSKAAARQLLASRPPSPYGRILLAGFLEAGGASSVAEEHYRAGVEGLPDEPEAWRALGQFYSKAQPGAEGSRKADEQFARAAKLESSGRVSRGDAAEVETAISHWRRGEYGQALKALRSVSASSREPRAAFWLSRTCMALARETFLAAIEKNPGSHRAQLLLADLARDQGDSATAEAGYRRAAALAFNDPEVQLLFIQFLAAHRIEDELFEKAAAAAERFPNHPALNSEYAGILLRRGRYLEAAVHFRKVLEAEPSFAAARAGLAEAYANTGDVEKSIAEMKAVLGADRDGSFHYRIARWYQETGRALEAQEAFAATARLKAEKLARDHASFLRSKTIGE